MQACARIGAIHSVVFGGFSAKSVRSASSTPGRLVITADAAVPRRQGMALKPAVDEALGMGGCSSMKTVVVYKRTGGR
jgi:acetyl-CoA synthetase